MKLLWLLIPLLTLMACETQPFTFETEDLRQTFAPDRRTDRVEVEWHGDTLTGYTTIPAAFDSLQQRLNRSGGINKVRLLPNPELADRPVGIIKVSVANLRSRPGHSQELASQALLGTPIQLMDKQDGWYLVRTPDRYLAWLEPGAFQRMTTEEMQEWYEGPLAMFQLPISETLDTYGEGTIIADPTRGGLVNVEGTENGRTYVRLPDGERGTNKAEAIEPIDLSAAGDSLNVEDIIKTAHTLAGRPYLWGGTSAKGMDCSGFTKMSYYLNGFVIPRDASQQVHVGEEIPVDDDLSALQRGDLIFFGRLRDDGSERITHVGLYLGDGRLLHSGSDNGRIKEDNLLPGRPGYNEKRRASIMRVRRYRADDQGVIPLKEAFEEFYTRSSSE